MVDVRRALAALACALVLVGCTPAAPAGPTPSPTPAVETPPETAQERQQRLDYAAAEKSYRAFRAEFNRVLKSGGASSATPKMRQTAGGTYIRDTTEVVQAYKGLENRQTGDEIIGYVRPSGHSKHNLVLDVCEDTKNVRTLDAAGKVIGRGDVRSLELEVRLVGSTWRLWGGTGKKVDSCE